MDSQPAQIPYQYKPLTSWAYFGYALLFSLPVVGFILLIVFSCSNENINRRNFARSYWCALLVAVILLAALFLLFLLLGYTDEINQGFQNFINNALR